MEVALNISSTRLVYAEKQMHPFLNLFRIKYFLPSRHSKCDATRGDLSDQIWFNSNITLHSFEFSARRDSVRHTVRSTRL